MLLVSKAMLNIISLASINLSVSNESEDTTMMWGYDLGWGGWFMMSFGMVFWIALLAVLTWALIRWVNNKTAPVPPRDTTVPPSSPSAIEILRQRYARGEIDTITFEQMRERLEGPGMPGYQQSEKNQPIMNTR
jgi:putative membrane protein